MAHRRMDVDRLDRIAAGRHQYVVHLRKLEEVAEIRLVAGPAAVVEVGAVRRRRHLREDQIVAAEAHIVRRVARMQRELARAVLDQLEDHVGVEAHALGAFAHVGAVLLHDAPGIVVQHVDADLLQHAQRRQMDQFELVVGDQLGRREGVLQLPERRLLEGSRAAGALACAAAAAHPVGGERGFGWMKRGGHGGPHGMMRSCVASWTAARRGHCGGGD